MKRGGVGTGSKCLSFAYGLACALQFCVGKTTDGLFVADKFNFSDFLTETELYKQKRTRSFCLLGRRSASFLRLNEFFGCGIFPKPSPVPKTAFCKLPESVRLKNLTLAVC